MKGKRQEKILEIIKNDIIINQEDLQSTLERHGFNVTQSTVSRDIKELRIVKSHDGSGTYRYTVEEPAADDQSAEHYRELFARAAKSTDYSFNNVIVKCYNGMASGACVAMDMLFGEFMLGSLAGEDTIIAVTRGEAQSVALVRELKNLL